MKQYHYFTTFGRGGDSQREELFERQQVRKIP